jgi:hypothetical protein
VFVGLAGSPAPGDGERDTVRAEVVKRTVGE